MACPIIPSLSHLRSLLTTHHTQGHTDHSKVAKGVHSGRLVRSTCYDTATLGVTPKLFFLFYEEPQVRIHKQLSQSFGYGTDMVSNSPRFYTLFSHLPSTGVKIRSSSVSSFISKIFILSLVRSIIEGNIVLIREVGSTPRRPDRPGH